MNTKLMLAAGTAAAILLSACASTEVDEPAAPAPEAPAEDDVPAEGQLPDPDETDPPLVPVGETPTESEDEPADEVDTPAEEPAECQPGDEREAPVEVEAMPETVEAMRDFLLDAALRCDEQLLRTAIDESSQFNFSFGGEEDAIAYWNDLEAAGEMPYRRLADALLTTPALADGDVAWVWPAVTTGRPETRTPELLAELDWVDDGIRQLVEGGDSYLGWRVGITPEGEWRFFVIGD